MYKPKKTLNSPVFILTLLLSLPVLTEPATPSTMDFLRAVVLPENGIGAREAGTKAEQKAADFVFYQFEKMGYTPEIQHFSQWVARGKERLIHSSNVIANKKGQSEKVLVLGAHIDSAWSIIGSNGASDNGTGLAVLLSVAAHISTLESMPFSVRFVAFGAEEVGKVGSRAYLKELESRDGEIAKIIGMVNLDSVAGGDFLYIYSAHTSPYKCGGDTSQYNGQSIMRDAVLQASYKTLKSKVHKLSPAYPGYPEGVTGDWSDHEPFSCHGIPIAYIESSNFHIKGFNGYDGQSQSVNTGLWDCFDTENASACDRNRETRWGRIWHTENDRLEYLEELFPGRIREQLKAHVVVLNAFFSHADQYLEHANGKKL